MYTEKASEIVALANQLLENSKDNLKELEKNIQKTLGESADFMDDAASVASGFLGSEAGSVIDLATAPPVGDKQSNLESEALQNLTHEFSEFSSAIIGSTISDKVVESRQEPGSSTSAPAFYIGEVEEEVASGEYQF